MPCQLAELISRDRLVIELTLLLGIPYIAADDTLEGP